MKRKLFIKCLLILLGGALKCSAQPVIPEQLTAIEKQLEGMDNMAYDYAVEQKLPDGTVNKLKGRMEKRGNYYTESNSEELIIQDEKWWYKADHARKTVTIIDAEAVKKKMSNHGQDIFSKPAALVPDSIVARYGKIKVTTEKNIAKVLISFSKEVMISELYLEYDMQKQLPLVYRVKMLLPYAINSQSFEESYMNQVFTASNFSVSGAGKELKLADYFSWEKGKVRLKKYREYRVSGGS